MKPVSYVGWIGTGDACNSLVTMLTIGMLLALVIMASSIVGFTNAYRFRSQEPPSFWYGVYAVGLLLGGLGFAFCFLVAFGSSSAYGYVNIDCGGAFAVLCGGILVSTAAVVAGIIVRSRSLVYRPVQVIGGCILLALAIFFGGSSMF